VSITLKILVNFGIFGDSINLLDLNMSYQGKFAPLSEDFVQQTRKRQRRSSSATSASPHPFDIPGQSFVPPSKEEFVSFDMGEKMNSLFDMMVQFGPINYKLECINRHMYHTAATQDITESRLRLLEYKSIDM
jgi:hypothetical protein